MSTITGLFGSTGGGGLKPKFQEFFSSGTFTPSAGLLAQGGICQVTLIGGGGSGGGAWSSGYVAGGGGGAGGTTIRTVQVTGPVSVTLGAGGPSVGVNTDGNIGGTSMFGIMVFAPGGGGGMKCISNSTPYPAGGKGGVLGQDGAPGGGGMYTLISNGGNSSIGSAGGVQGGTGNGAAGGLGAGGGSMSGWGSSPVSGQGGPGYCRVDWWE